METKEVSTHHIPKQDDVRPIDVFIINSGEGNFEVTISYCDKEFFKKSNQKNK